MSLENTYFTRVPKEINEMICSHLTRIIVDRYCTVIEVNNMAYYLYHDDICRITTNSVKGVIESIKRDEQHSYYGNALVIAVSKYSYRISSYGTVSNIPVEKGS